MSRIGEATISIVADASGFGATASDEVTKALKGVADNAAGIFDSIESDSTAAFDSMGGAASDAADSTARSLSEVMNEVSSMTDKAARDAADSFGDVSSAAGRAGRDAGTAMGDGLSGVQRAAANAAEGASDALGGVVGSAGRAGEGAASAMGGAFSSIRSAAASAAEGAGNALKGIGGSIRGALSSAADGARSAAGSIRTALSESFRGAEQAALRIPPAIMNIGMGLAAVAGPAAMLKGGFDRLMDIQRSEITFRNIGLSAEETTAQMEQLSEQVTGTSVSLSDAAKYSAMFAQSGVEMGEPMNNAIDAFANLAAASVGSGVDVGRVLQQMSAQGKVTGGDLNQLSTAGVNAAQYLAEHMGMSVAEVRDAVTAGEITFEDFIAAMNAGMGDLATEMGETLPAKMSNFKTAIANLGATIIEPFIPAITAVTEFGIEITKAVVGPLKTFIGWLQEGSAPAQILKDVLIALGVALAAAFTPGLIGLIMAAGVALKGVMATVWAATGPVGIAIGLLVGGFVLLWNRSEAFRNFWIGLWDSVKDTVMAAVDPIRDAWDSVKDVFSGGLGDMFSGDSSIMDWLGQLKDVAIDVWNTIKEAGSGLMSAGWDLIVAVFEAATIAGTALRDAWIQVAGAVWGLVQALAPVLMPILKVIGAVVGGVLVAAFFLLIGALKVVAQIFGVVANVISWVAENVLTPLIGVIALVVTALVDRLGGAISWVVDFVPKAFQWVKDAGVALWEGLRDVFTWIGEAATTVWEFMQSAWESVGRPVFEGIVTVGKWMVAIVATAVIAPLLIVWNTLSAGIKWAWDSLIKPAWEDLTTIALWMWNSVLMPTFNLISQAWQALAAGVMSVYQNIILPAWNAVGAAANWLWSSVLMPVFNFIQLGWQALATGIRSIYENVILVAWNAVGAAANWLWSNVLMPVFNFIRLGWQTLAAGIMSIWNNVIKVAWDAMGNALRWLYDNVVLPVLQWIRDRWTDMGNNLRSTWRWIDDNVFKALGRGLDWVRDSFTRAVDAITRIWERIRGAAARPVRFIIDTVWNNGILRAWNAVAGLVGLDKQDSISHDLGGFRSGGVLSGWSPGRDDRTFYSPSTGERVSMAGGEAIMVPQWTKAVGGPAAVAQMNRAALSGTWPVEKHGRESAAFAGGGVFDLGGFNAGGVIPAMINIVRQKYPGLTMTSGRRAGGGMHGAGLATDWSNGNGPTPMQLALAQDIARTYPGSAELIYDHPGWAGNIKNGRNVGPFGQFYTLAQAGRHDHHVHWGMTTPPTMPFGGGVFEGGSDGGGGGFWQSITSAVKSMWDSIVGKIGKWTGGGGEIAQMPGAFLKKAGDMAWNFVKEKADQIMSWSGGGGSAEQWRDMAMDAMRRNGFNADDPAQVDAMLRQIMSESSGNPAAIQGIIDVNSGGNEAAGLLQVIPGTFAAYRDPSLPNDRLDPWANMNAALRYYRARYGGDLTTMWGHGHGYHLGGLMGSGTGMFHKTAMEPEMVLSPEQTDALVDWLRAGVPQGGVATKFATEVVDLLGARSMRAVRLGGGSGGDHSTRTINVTQHVYDNEPKRAADDIRDFLERW